MGRTGELANVAAQGVVEVDRGGLRTEELMDLDTRSKRRGLAGDLTGKKEEKEEEFSGKG